MEGQQLVCEGASLGMKRAHLGMENVHLEHGRDTRAIKTSQSMFSKPLCLCLCSILCTVRGEGCIWSMEGANFVWEGAYLVIKRVHWGMEKVHLEHQRATRAVLSKAWGPWGGQSWKAIGLPTQKMLIFQLFYNGFAWEGALATLQN